MYLFLRYLGPFSFYCESETVVVFNIFVSHKVLHQGSVYCFCKGQIGNTVGCGGHAVSVTKEKAAMGTI